MGDVLVVGGGPSGLSAALTLGRVRRGVVLADDGSPRAAASPALHNFLTREGIAPLEFLGAARDELARYDSVEPVDDAVTSLDGEDGAFEAVFASGRRESVAKVLLACGVDGELPAIDGLGPLWGTTVLHCPYCHGWEHRDRPLVVIGDDGRAVAQALHLTGLSERVTLCTDGGPALDGVAESRLREAGVDVLTGSISRVRADGGALQAVELEDGTSVPAEAAFVGPAARPRSRLAEALGCALLEGGTVRVNALGGTTVAGVYAAGDLARNPDVPFRGQMILSAAAGTLAAMAIEEELLTGVRLTSDDPQPSGWRRRRR